MKTTRLPALTFVVINLLPMMVVRGETSPSPAVTQEPATESGKLVTVEGEDLPFAELLKSSKMKVGERFSGGPVLGSRVRVNHELLQKQTSAAPSPIPKKISLHTQASGGIQRKNFDNWTRWYQEDGNVQIFRLFEGEQSIRDGLGAEGKPGRVETFTKRNVEPGAWREWEATYTIIEPVGANIFQLFHEGGQLWAFHIRMNNEGSIYFSRRRDVPDLPKQVILAKDMVGKSLRIKVRANGTDYEVFCKDPADGKPWGEPITKGRYQSAENNQISFRWGMYCGSAKGGSIKKDAMMLVSDVTID